MTSNGAQVRRYNFFLTGVGGQGTLLAADVVALVGMALGADVKKSEVHGMAQRGGSVVSHVRWGDRVLSPLIAPGEVDFMVAFERLEALRYAKLLRPSGVLLVNDYRIAPVSVTSGSSTYPTEQDEAAVYGAVIQKHEIPALALAQELGQPRVNNIVMLGALSTFLDTPEDVWLQVISQRVPQRFVEINRQAFAVGRGYLGKPQQGEQVR